MYFLCRKQANLSEVIKLKGILAWGINEQPAWNMHISFLFAKIMVNMEVFHVLKINSPLRNSCRHTVWIESWNNQRHVHKARDPLGARQRGAQTTKHPARIYPDRGKCSLYLIDSMNTTFITSALWVVPGRKWESHWSIRCICCFINHYSWECMCTQPVWTGTDNISERWVRKMYSCAS